jgi:hypothetical protein
MQSSIAGQNMDNTIGCGFTEYGLVRDIIFFQGIGHEV